MINFEELRQDLISCIKDLSGSNIPMSMIDLGDIEEANEEDLVNIAISLNINLDKYKKN